MILPDLSCLTKSTQATSIGADSLSPTLQPQEEAQAYRERLDDNLKDLFDSFVKNPREAKLLEHCSNDDIQSDKFWHILCIEQNWHRPDRTTGVHAINDFTWRKQFFRWSKLRFAENGHDLRIALEEL